MRLIFAFILLCAFRIATAQITTSEVTVESTGDLTKIQGKTAVAMTSDPVFDLTVSANLNNPYLSTPDIAAIGIMTHGIGTGQGNLYLHRDDVTISIGDILGALRFSGADGGEQIGAEIRGVSSGSWNPGSSAGDLVFLTNPTGVTEPLERMRINRYGNVGIGTATPGSTLDVAGVIQSDYLTLAAANANEGGELSLKGPSGYNDWIVDNYRGRYRLHHSGTAYFVVETNGKVGIGTSEPGANLHIQQSDHLGLKFSRDNNHDDYVLGVMGNQGLHIKNTSDDRDELIFDGQGNLIIPGKVKAPNASSPGIFVQQQGPQGIRFSRDSNHDDYILALAGSRGLYIKNATDGRDEMVFRGDGNIGIGTDSPGYKLDINGSLNAQSLYNSGQLQWSDFVFEKEYDLPSLEEVEEHIAENGHLKDIPSEEEVLDDGYDLGTMDSKLLQKIEELTLYLIEQNKKIDHLIEENTQLKTRVQVLEQQ